jgi:mycothione reductase
MKEFDLVVVGSGAGLLVLQAGLKAGWQCALIESGKIGGTCLNRGCIPTKILAYPADLLREIQAARRIGLSVRDEGLDWDLLSSRLWRKIDANREMEDGLRAQPGLTFYRGVGEFSGPKTLRIRAGDGSGDSEELTGARIVLATGARSFVPPIPGLEDAGYVTTESFFGDKFPRRPWPSLVIIGGGIIAAEFAHVFSAAGTKVTIVEMLPRLLATEEPQVAALVEREFRKSMELSLNKRATAARRINAEKIVVFEDVTTGEIGEAAADEILVAVGRRSNADLLHLEKSGIRTTRQGWIEADAYLQTSQPGVWAIGDALGGFQFRHKANYDAEILIRNMFGPPDERMPVDYSVTPWAIFTHPQVGHVGLTESEALARGHEILTAVQSYSAVAKGYAMGYEEGRPDDGFVKVIVDKSGLILGVHVVGPEAALLVQPFVYMMNAGYVCPPEGRTIGSLPREQRACLEAGTYFPIDRSMIIHPTLSELTGWAFSMLKPVNIRD